MNPIARIYHSEASETTGVCPCTSIVTIAVSADEVVEAGVVVSGFIAGSWGQFS